MKILCLFGGIVFSAQLFAVDGRHSGIVKIFSGPSAFATCALLADARISCWGDGTKTPKPFDVAGHDVFEVSLSEKFGCALIRDSRVFCWGDNSSGELGTVDAHANAKPVQYNSADFDHVTAIAVGDQHVCALRIDGGAWCWGSNMYGQLGNFRVGIGSSATQPVQVVIHDEMATPPNPVLRGLKSISSGIFHSCALLNDNTGACWGYDQDGELGNGKSRANYDSPQTVLVEGSSGLQPLVLSGGVIQGGGYHSCGLVGDVIVDSVACWGWNDFGELGIGNTATETWAFPAQAEVGKITNAFSVVTGEYFTCAIISDLTVRCWGSNAHYQIANPTVGLGAKQLVGTIAFAESGATLRGVVSLVAGDRHVCAMLVSNEVFCWGDNEHFQLGDISMTQTNVPQNIAIDVPLFTDNFDGN